MSDSQLQAGDVVTLKSGGPKMTIEVIGKFSMHSAATLKAKCSWFEGMKRVEGTFEIVSLEKAGS